MSSLKTALILYPHQLYPANLLPQVDTIFVVEEPLFFGMDQEFPLKLHKQKLILHRASMQRYVKEVLWPTKVDVQYIELDVFMKTSDILDRAKGFEHLYIFDPVNDILTDRLLRARRENDHGTALEFLHSPNFYLKDQEVREYFGPKPKHPFDEFYQWQRERFNILIGEDFKPIGGQWSFDKDTHHKLPADHQLPTFAVFGNNDYVHEAIKWVEQHCPNNPGSTDFVWPTNHAEALTWLEAFIKDRLEQFGPYYDAIDGQALWLHHSALSSSLNIGLLSPGEVVETVMKHQQKRAVPLPSLETFIQQILGRREFTRGLYTTQHQTMRSSNPFRHSRKLTADWYEGKLGLPPFDDLVHKIKDHAYAQQNERLSIAGNLMLLCEIAPDDIHRWFSELFIDAYEWTTLPNVFGLSQFTLNSTLGNQPCISASNYLLEMSEYGRGEWCNVWDGLFWRFIEKHRHDITHNPRMRTMAQRLDRLDPDQKRIISYRAEDFLTRFTQ